MSRTDVVAGVDPLRNSLLADDEQEAPKQLSVPSAWSEALTYGISQHATPSHNLGQPRQWTLALPLALQNLFNYLLGVFIIMFVGRLGEFELSAMVLASSLYNVTGYAILFGFSSSIETLGGAAFGSGNYAKCGIILQQALLINTIVFVAVCGLWTQFDPLLRAFGTVCFYHWRPHCTILNCTPNRAIGGHD